MSKVSTFIEVWGRKPLGEMIRDWWNARLRASAKLTYPWSDEEQEAANGPDAVGVCHRCITPQEHLGWFCPECGTATGPYNNCMPFVYIFSAGEVVRAGVDGKTRFAKWVYPTYFLVGAYEFFIFAPLYWIRLILAQKRRIQHLKAIDHDEIL